MAMAIDTSYLEQCITTLDSAFQLLQKEDSNSTMYSILRAACVKEFELVLEQSGKLLRKRLADFHASPKEVARLAFKDLFRSAAKFDLINVTQVERWLVYRDNRNHTAHDYGEGFAESTLVLLPDFIADAQSLCKTLKENSASD